MDHDGNVDGINYSVPQRDSRFSISIDKVDEWYKAKAKFVELIHEEAVTFKTNPGNKLLNCSMTYTGQNINFHSANQVIFLPSIIHVVCMVVLDTPIKPITRDT